VVALALVPGLESVVAAVAFLLRDQHRSECRRSCRPSPGFSHSTPSNFAESQLHEDESSSTSCKAGERDQESLDSSQSEISACLRPFDRYGKWTLDSTQTVQLYPEGVSDCNGRNECQPAPSQAFEHPLSVAQPHPSGWQQKSPPSQLVRNTVDPTKSLCQTVGQEEVSFGDTDHEACTDQEGMTWVPEEDSDGRGDSAPLAYHKIPGGSNFAHEEVPAKEGHDEHPNDSEHADDTAWAELQLPDLHDIVHQAHCPVAQELGGPAHRKLGGADGDMDPQTGFLLNLDDADESRLPRVHKPPRS